MTRPFARLSLALLLALAAAARADDTPKEAAPKDEKEKAAAAPVLVDLTIKGSIPEEPTPVGLDGAPIEDNVKGLLDRIARAKADKEVRGLIVRVRGLAIGAAKSAELRRALKDFRKSGKKVFAVLEEGGNPEYFLATAADEIVMPEAGWLMLKGLAAEVTFFKKAFDKFGIHADALQVGEYKAAGEPYSRTEMSPAFREELTSVLKDRYDQFAEAIAARQGIAPDEAKKLIDGGPYTPTAAKELGLINRIAYPDQLETEIAKDLGVAKVRLETKYGKKKVDPNEFQGLGGFMKLMQQLTGEPSKKASSDKPKVAIIYATGMIVPGRSSSGSLLGDAVMGSDTVVKHLREAEKDKTVKAIVLRVDSPGGSALASDLIWRETVRIEKPIVASMSDVAGSGGYYISMGCDKVYAEPGTLTGSIGVISVHLAFGGLLEKVGVTTDTVVVGKNGDLLSATKPLSPEGRAALKRFMDEVYKGFVSKAAEGRKMDRDKLEKLAGGRIYTGRQAKANGLVDELGTLEDAIAAAKGLGGIEGDAELLTLPHAPSFFEALIAPFEDREALMPSSSALAAALPEPLRAPLRHLTPVLRLFSSEPAVLMPPFELRIR